eukprot:768375-Hanusia_phi.AAC.2
MINLERRHETIDGSQGARCPDQFRSCLPKGSNGLVDLHKLQSSHSLLSLSSLLPLAPLPPPDARLWLQQQEFGQRRIAQR